jgi:hypothetical protein
MEVTTSLYDDVPSPRRNEAFVGGVHLMGYRNEGVLAQAIIESELRTTRNDAALQA